MPDAPKLITRKLQRLHHRAMAILTREIGHLENLSISEKLGGTAARDLRDYIKLLGELKETSLDLEAAREREDRESATTSSEQELVDALAKSTPQ